MTVQEKIEVLKVAAQIFSATTNPGRASDKEQLEWFRKCAEAVYAQLEGIREGEAKSGRSGPVLGML